MVIIMLLAMQIPTEMSKMLKRQRRAQEKEECCFCSVTTLPLLRTSSQNSKQTKCRTETQKEQPVSRKAEKALPPLPSFKTLQKAGSGHEGQLILHVLQQSAGSLKLRG